MESELFEKILIANRGEIACRIARTCREMGIATVAVFSDADADSAHVAVCDEAIHIGASAARESYLNQQRVIEVALLTGAQAIHPGYGFLSENADFAQACAAAGLVFIGAPASAIRAMGSKAQAKQLMMGAGVPLVHGYHGDNQDADFLRQQAQAVGYPVIIKATAGGGGKGMRVVQGDAEFASSLASCQREASASFGDDTVLIERYVNHPRHIEVQIFADQHGQCVYLFDRDCSVQRRHQKIIEEAPAPMVDDDLRTAMGHAAVQAAKAVDYVGAGTVEFIVESDAQGQAQRFFFMEMNTRLQVEHPVTEMVTGEDLVAWQLKVAAGQPLPKLQHELVCQGHAIEARIYAENPSRQFLPSVGTLKTLRLPSEQPGLLRIDSGVREGDTISPFYDPMIAKMMAWAPDRQIALRHLARALTQSHVVGVKTNIQFLHQLLRCPAFSQPNLSTSLIEHNREFLFANVPDVPLSVYAGLVAYQLQREEQWPSSSTDSHAARSPWQIRDYWRLDASASRAFEFDIAGHEGSERVTADFASQTLTVRGQVFAWQYRCLESTVTVRLDDRVQALSIYVGSDEQHDRAVFLDGQMFACRYLEPLRFDGSVQEQGGTLTAPMPGRVLALHVKQGDRVRAGQPLIVLEAMKMEHTMTALAEGEVQAIHFSVGDQVAEGVELLAISPLA